MGNDNTTPTWFKHFTNGKMSKLQAKISRMHPTDIKRRFEKSLRDGLLYGISREYERALAIYQLSDESLKEELDNISMELQNKKIDINESITDTFAMAHPLIAKISELKKESLTPLMSASWFGFTEEVRNLLEAGADVNERNELGYTALISAAGSRSTCNTEIVQILLEAGADMNAKDDKGWTALQMAKSNFNRDIIKLLKEAGAEE